MNTKQQTLELLRELITNPVVYNTLFLLVVGLIPKRVTDKLPIVGTVINLIKTVLDAQTAKQEAKKTEAGAVVAQTLVSGYEQLKSTGHVDSATAAKQSIQAVMEKTNLSREDARIVVEHAVRTLPQKDQQALPDPIKVEQV